MSAFGGTAEIIDPCIASPKIAGGFDGLQRAQRRNPRQHHAHEARVGGAVSHEPENLHDSSQRDIWSRSVTPCVVDFLWLAGRNQRLDDADVVKLDRSRRRRRLELLRNKPRHA
jgi:hypothetical protein